MREGYVSEGRYVYKGITHVKLFPPLNIKLFIKSNGILALFVTHSSYRMDGLPSIGQLERAMWR